MAYTENLPQDDLALVPSLLSIAKSTRNYLGLHLRDAGLFAGQDHLLAAMQSDVPVSVTTLAEMLSVRPATISKMVDKLAEKNLALRLDDAADARRTMVMLTPRGEEAKRAVETIWARLDKDLCGTLEDDELIQISSALRQANVILQTRLRRLR